MAWVFSLSAECGDKQSNAEAFAHQFEGLSCALSNGIQVCCQATVFQDMEDNWWCRVQPIGLPEVGVTTPEVAYGMTELGIWLYQRLQSSSAFRYALVGVEVDEFRTHRELMDEPLMEAFPGLVSAEDLWRSMGSPVMFRSFCSGYVWKPYEGEVYKPLMASPALKGKLEELLVLR